MWTSATIADINELTSFFINNLVDNPQYISHGEMQMGIALAPGILSPDAITKWENYISDKIDKMVSKHKSNVIVYKNEGVIDAFCVLDITNDGADDFGVICDMIVKSHLRGQGIGKQMLNMAKEWFKEMSIDSVYLESGLDNSKAHKFFEDNGFRPVSHIFKLF